MNWLQISAIAVLVFILLGVLGSIVGAWLGRIADTYYPPVEDEDA